MKTQNIEVEGLPEGWEVEKLVLRARIENNKTEMIVASLVTLKKIQPRRIVLEEISKEEYHRLFHDERCTEIYNLQRSYWKQVKETDIPLTNSESKLSLSVDECKEAMRKLETFNVTDLSVKICRFLKDK